MKRQDPTKSLVLNLIRECEILLIRIFKLEKANAMQSPISRSAPSTWEEDQEQNKIQTSYTNKVRKRKIIIKAYFTLLILDLVHIIHLDQNLSKIAEQIILQPAQKRFKRNKEQIVNNLRDLIFFFRDAICHPEEKNDEVSPRRSVKYNFDVKDTFMSDFYDKSKNDITCRIGDCTIRLKEIKSLLKNKKTREFSPPG